MRELPQIIVHPSFAGRTGLGWCVSLWTHLRSGEDRRTDSETLSEEHIMKHTVQPSKSTTSRRSFLRRGLAVGGAGTIGAGLLTSGLSLPAFAQAESGGLTPGDAAILRFLSALETLETDFWQQYNELGGVQDSEV